MPPAPETSTDAKHPHGRVPDPATAFHRLGIEISDAKSHLGDYVHAKIDGLKATVRNAVLLAGLCVVMLLIAIAVLVVGAAMLVIGAAGAISAIFNASPWLGQLIVGGALLAAVVTGGALFYTRINRARRDQTLMKRADAAMAAMHRALDDFARDFANTTNLTGWIQKYPISSLAASAAAAFTAAMVVTPSKRTALEERWNKLMDNLAAQLDKVEASAGDIPRHARSSAKPSIKGKLIAHVTELLKTALTTGLSAAMARQTYNGNGHPHAPSPGTHPDNTGPMSADPAAP